MCVWGTTVTLSPAVCACGNAVAARSPSRRKPPTAADERGARWGGTSTDLVQQRQGDRRLRARFLAAVVHDRRRHHQRGLLPAGRSAADPRPGLHRCRWYGLLGGGEAAV